MKKVKMKWKKKNRTNPTTANAVLLTRDLLTWSCFGLASAAETGFCSAGWLLAKGAYGWYAPFFTPMKATEHEGHRTSSERSVDTVFH
jgi:hypothetical protein